MDRNSIITVPNKLLRQRSQRISVIDDEVLGLAQNMIAAMSDWEDHRQHELAVALAAPQVAKLERLIVVRTNFEDKSDRHFEAFINPEIVKREGEITEEAEGCLSVADIYGLVPRYSKIKVRALTLEGKAVRLTLSGFIARIFQHEVDHLQGKLFIDVVEGDNFLKLSDKGEFVSLPENEYDKYHLKD